MNETNVTLEWIAWFTQEWINMQKLFEKQKEKERAKENKNE